MVGYELSPPPYLFTWLSVRRLLSLLAVSKHFFSPEGRLSLILSPGCILFLCNHVLSPGLLMNCILFAVYFTWNSVSRLPKDDQMYKSRNTDSFIWCATLKSFKSIEIKSPRHRFSSTKAVPLHLHYRSFSFPGVYRSSMASHSLLTKQWRRTSSARDLIPSLEKPEIKNDVQFQLVHGHGNLVVV